MRKLLLAVAILVGGTLTGLLLASLLLKQECPDCMGIAKYFADNPSQVEDGPVVTDCRRCDNLGRVSLLNGRLAPAPDPLMVNLIRRTNRTYWGDDTVARELQARLKASGLKTASGKDWESPVPLFIERSRFIRREGKTYILALLQKFADPDGRSAWVLLFEQRGGLVDALSVTVRGGPSWPASSFVVPVDADGRCVQIRALIWKNDLCDRIEIDHGGTLSKSKPDEPREKLGDQTWDVHVRDGKLRIVEAATRKSVPE